MRNRTRAAIGILTLALLITGLGPAAPPAAADHANDPGHWRSGVYPIVTVPYCAGNGCELVQDAAYFWQNRGYTKGFTPPLPRTGYDCNPNWNEISVCFVDYSNPVLQGNLGITHRSTYPWDLAHMGWAQIFVCGNCSGWDQQATLRHEMGHALGLGHTGDPNCVMHDPVYILGETCWHDHWQMATMYNHRD